jgi:hypothetical protein
MPVIRVKSFGGLVPKASKRALPDNAAQTATNLLASTNEFRPLQNNTAIVADSGVTNPKTIHRLQRTASGAFNLDFATASNWKVSPLELSYARHQVNNDVTERTSVTYNDGSAAPRVIDATGSDRLLGVPKPTTAPSVTVGVADEFTVEERAGGIENILLYLKNSTASLIVPVWRGATRAGTATDGYVDRDNSPGVDPEEAQQLRVFRTSSTGGANSGTISDAYTSDETDSFSWVFEAGLGGFWTLPASIGSPTWAGTVYDHYAIPFHAYGLTYDINPDLDDALAAIEMPGGTAGQKLLTGDQVNACAQLVAAMSNQQWTDVAPKINALKAKVTQAKSVMDGGSHATLAAATAAFYDKAEITALFTTAVANAAERIWNKAQQAAGFVEFSPPPGGGA